jgi:multimeric flavodoxin WrbA
VFATPIYFHHVSAPLKKLIDRFRSFVKVQITESGLLHTPWQSWNKDFVLLLSMGSSDASEADPVLDLFKFFKTVLGTKNRLHTISATRLAVINQLTKSEEELGELYKKMELPVKMAKDDFKKNHELLDQAYMLGRSLT